MHHKALIFKLVLYGAAVTVRVTDGQPASLRLPATVYTPVAQI